MKSKFNVDLQMSVGVQFENPEKAKAYFIDGGWKDCFWDVKDLETLTRDLATNFILESSTLMPGSDCFLEGFGEFIWLNLSGVYTLSEEFKELRGDIIITQVSPLQVNCVTEETPENEK